ncbi:universal stress protein [Amycolatopsis magusensis]|uniref:Nucleotide-binding universal stress UspA family protein n=1 Tax=Amycolatopsis magusensis TaxID=882444 RepID=A0ABS4PWA1_9PSEU|nr:universal stress protein [Amycolatopsis magusensis]MBP2183690.1 nucleotide-binding universal stress UspA family protein [Amycolatopsis magusensis]
MSVSPTGNPPVLVAVDGSEPALAATRWAVEEAVRLHAPLMILSAYGLDDVSFAMRVYPPMEWLEAKKEAAEHMVRDAAAVAAEMAPGLPVHTRVSPLGSVSVLRELSCHVRMLVLGEPGGAVSGLIVGSTSIPVLAGADCPVVIVRGRDRGRPQEGPVVVGVDGSPNSEAAIAQGFAEASARNAPLVAVHTWHDGDTEVLFSQSRARFDWEPLHETEQRVLAERLAGWREQYPDVAVERVVLQDKPRHRLLEWSEKARLIVVGSRGRGGFTGLLLGSTSQALAHHADCTVMVVRHRAA